MAKSGVYEILNNTNGHRYIGSTADTRKRWNCHRHLLCKELHPNAHLQSAWTKYGGDAFVFRTLLYCDAEMFIIFEQQVMDALKPEYNIRPVAKSNLGIKHTTKSRANMSAGHIDYEFSAKHRENLSLALMGNTCGRGGKGREVTPETRSKLSMAKIGNQNAKGYKHTPSERAKMSVSKKGKPWSSAQRAAREALYVRRKTKENDNG